MAVWLTILALCIPSPGQLRTHEARAVTVMTVLLQETAETPTPAPQPSPRPGPSRTCTCRGSGKSGDNIGPCVCVAGGGTCTCTRSGPASPAPPRKPAAPVAPPVAKERSPQVLLLVLPGCASCASTEECFPALRAQGWQVDRTPQAHVRVVDLSQDLDPWIAALGREQAIQAIYTQQQLPLRWTEPGRVLTAKDITDLYYNTPPVQQPTPQAQSPAKQQPTTSPRAPEFAPTYWSRQRRGRR